MAVKVYINTEEETLERENTSTDFLLNYPRRKHLWSYLKCFPLCVGGVTDSVSPSSAPVRAPPAAAGSLRLRGENHLPRGQGTWRTQVSFSLPSPSPLSLSLSLSLPLSLLSLSLSLPLSLLSLSLPLLSLSLSLLPLSLPPCVRLKCEYVVCKCYFTWTVSLL